MNELPLRIVDQPGGFVIRCLCGAESALVKASVMASAAIIRANRGTGIANRAVSPDLTPAAVLRMALHARSCEIGRSRQAEICRLTAAPLTGGG